MDLGKEMPSQSLRTAGKELPGGLCVEGWAWRDGGAVRTFWELWWALLTQEDQLSQALEKQSCPSSSWAQNCHAGAAVFVWLFLPFSDSCNTSGLLMAGQTSLLP